MRFAPRVNCDQAACKQSIPRLRSTPMQAIEMIMPLADSRGMVEVRDGDLFQRSYPDSYQTAVSEFV